MAKVMHPGHKYATLLGETGQHGKLCWQAHLLLDRHGLQYTCFELFVLTDSTPVDRPPPDAVRVMTAGIPASPLWYHTGRWVTDFEQLVATREAESSREVIHARQQAVLDAY